jgi:hypothetical protein
MQTADQGQRQGRSPRAIEGVDGGCCVWRRRGARVQLMVARTRVGLGGAGVWWLHELAAARGARVRVNLMAERMRRACA